MGSIFLVNRSGWFMAYVNLKVFLLYDLVERIRFWSRDCEPVFLVMLQNFGVCLKWHVET